MKTKKWLLAMMWGIAIVAISLSIWLDPERSTGGILFALVLGVVGTLIVTRQPRNPVGWTFIGAFAVAIVSSLLGFASLAYLDRSYEVPFLSETTLIFVNIYLNEVVGVAVWFSLLTFAIVFFPSGELLSIRWRYYVRVVAALLILKLGVGIFDPALSSDLFPEFQNPYAVPVIGRVVNIVEAILILATVIAPLSLVFRFRRARGVERQQIKWPLVSALIGFIGLGWLLVLSLATGAEMGDPAINDPFVNAGLLLEVISVLSFPITIGIAILRFRLYDIDIIIRRTLQYTLISGILALVYFGSVVQLGSLFQALTGQDSPLAIVISTLAIAALFNPVRNRVQRFIDRRFYRARYDAQQTLANFATAAREEVEIEKLSESLLIAVNETLQPEQVSLWLVGKNKKDTKIVPK